MPDPVQQADQANQQATQTAQPELPFSSQQTTQAAVDGGVSSQSAAQTAADQYTDILDVLKQQSPDLAARFRSGDQAVAYLLQEARRSEELSRLAPYAQEYQANAGAFQDFMRERAKAEAEKKARENAWFKAPEFDPSWRNAIEQDAQGNLRAKQGYPPDVVNKYLAWAQHQRSFLDKFASDPVGSIRPGIEQVVKEVAEQVMRQNLGGYAEQSQAQDFVRQNREWLYDQRGQLSEWGQVFAGAVREAEQIGLKNVAGQQTYAMRVVQHAYAMKQLGGQQAQQQAQQDPAKAAFLAQAQAQQPAAGAAAATGNSVLPPSKLPQGGNHTTRLQRLLAQRAKEAGLVNGDVAIPG